MSKKKHKKMNMKQQGAPATVHTDSFSKKKIIISTLIIALIIILSVIIGIIYYNKVVVIKKAEVAVKADPLGGITEEGIANGWDNERVTVYEDTSMDEGGITVKMYVPIPKGYVLSSIEGERTVKEGLVIYEGEEEANTEEDKKTRNQWVWIPVDADEICWTSTDGKKYGVEYVFSNTGATTKKRTSEPKIWNSYKYNYEDKYLAKYKSDFTSEEELERDMQISFYKMVASVKKYGGYYIGRYEAGDSTGTTSVDSKSKATGMPVIMQGKTVYNNITWYKAYDLAKLLAGTNENVETSLIWGTQWDNALKYLVKTENKSYSDMMNSTSWGNYSNSTFQYKNMSGSMSTKSGSILIPTGSAEYTKACNIYDLAGNVWEWTAEADSSSSGGRCFHGGSCYYNGDYVPASYRGSFNPVSGNGVGWRSALYIK